MADNQEALFHRKVQARLADRYLDALELEEETERNKRLDQEKHERLYKRQRFAAFTVQNVLWMVASMAVFHFSEFHNVVRFDPRINRMWFNVGVGLIGVTLAIAVFMIVWLSLVKKVHSDDWEKRHPAAIPVATASFIIGSLCLLKGLWPVWGLLTPLILVTLFMGVVVLIAMFG
ncbi:transmembrane protein 128-like [Babylonia areolata]|uniref:transmembrane protein 128-like n=1 Tax=Babylonia areolata TaxID=304850 RepID=UPI003FD5E5BF